MSQARAARTIDTAEKESATTRLTRTDRRRYKAEPEETTMAERGPEIDLKRLREVREGKDLSCEAVGLAIGTRKSRARDKISGIELGRIGCSMATLERIAAVLGVPAESLLAAKGGEP